MTRSSGYIILVFCCSMLLASSCNLFGDRHPFDELKRKIQIGNWEFALQVKNKSADALHQTKSSIHYLKATLDLSNTKTGKSLLYSISDGTEDYEVKYKYLSFGAKNDLFISYKDEYIFPIGYVFEPSNGLSNSERLVYTFQMDDTTYRKLKKDEEEVAYWFIDRMAGLGKICFTHNN